MKAH